MPLSPRDRRTVIVFGSVLVVALLGFFLFVHKGSKTPAATGSTAPIVTPAGGGVPQLAPSPSPSAHQQKLVFSGRDPFDPAQGGGSVAVTSTSTSGSTAPATVSPAGTPSSGPSGGSSIDIGGKTVVLVDIFTSQGVQKAQVEVDGTVYTVAEGGTFATSYQLVSINGSCADFLYGDQSFSLCESANK